MKRRNVILVNVQRGTADALRIAALRRMWAATLDCAMIRPAGQLALASPGSNEYMRRMLVVET